MIASGLCMMGGCFAQNGKSETVDSYWAASHVDMPPAEVELEIINFSFPGGDSVSDEITAASEFVWIDDRSEDGAAQLGIRNVNISGLGYVGGCFLRHLYTDGKGGFARLHYSGKDEPIDEGRDDKLVLRVRKGTAQVLNGRGDIIASSSAAYSLQMQNSRRASLRCFDVRKFAFLCYANAVTGVSWYVVPMKSTSDASAFWENYNNTLIEI